MPNLKEEQLKAINYDKGDLLISASAGSGKTFVMIQRLIRLITEKKATVKEVLAMTFTESAAADMKEKLFSAMIEKIEETGDEYLTSQLSDIPYADISTVHSFCSRLIRKYFYEVGVSPDYAICDETMASKLKNEALDLVMREYYAEKDKDFFTLLSRHASHRKDSNFRQLILSLYEYASSEADEMQYFVKTLNNYTEEGFNRVDLEYKKLIDKELLVVREGLKSVANDCATLGYSAGAEFCLQVIDVLNVYLKDSSVYVFTKIPFSVRLNFGRNLDGQGLFLKEKASGLRDMASATIKDVLKHISTREKDLEESQALSLHTDKLIQVINRFSRVYSKLKRDENVLDFNDLERFALEILNDEGIRKEINEKYKYVFVDEYQDTNGVQEAIITRLSKDNLFMVGDAKQSIYGFRGCRPEFFIEKYKKLKEQGKAIDMNYNFRSADGVLDAVNKVFAYSMTEDFYGQSYKDTAMLRGGGIYEKDGKKFDGRAELHLLLKEDEEKEKETPRVYNILEEIEKNRILKDSSQTASLVASLILKECGKKFYDVKTDSERQIEYKDICVLTRNKHADFVKDLVEGLVARNIPVTSDIDDSIINRPEIMQITSLMEIIDCFYNDVPLATVMKSPIGSFSEEELLTIQREFYGTVEGDKRDLTFYQAVEYVKDKDFAISKKVKEFCDYIDYLRELADFLPAKELLEKVVEDKALEEYLYATQNGKKKVGALRFFISVAKSGDKNYTIKEFLNLIKVNPDLFSYKGGGEEDTSVKVMTIHASKGLEFPVVIVCGLERNINKQDLSKEILTDRESGFAVRNYDDENKTYKSTIYRGYLKQKAKLNLIKEELRLFYVALTRARYSLHLSFVSDKDDRKDAFLGASKFLHYVPLSFDVTVHRENEFDFINETRDKRKVLIDEENTVLSERLKKDFSFVYPFMLETTLPIKTTVTAVNQGLEREYKEVIRFDETESETKTSVLAGTIAHKILEHYDFEKGLSLPVAVDEMIERGELTKEEIALVNLDKIEKAIRGGAFDKLKGKTLYREKSFLANVPASLLFDSDTKTEVLVQGKIDLLAIGDNTVQIVDYKYSALPKDVLKEKYKKQLKLYAYAVEKVLKVKVSDLYLISLLTGETVAID